MCWDSGRCVKGWWATHDVRAEGKEGSTRMGALRQSAAAHLARSGVGPSFVPSHSDPRLAPGLHIIHVIAAMLGQCEDPPSNLVPRPACYWTSVKPLLMAFGPVWTLQWSNRYWQRIIRCPRFRLFIAREDCVCACITSPQGCTISYSGLACTVSVNQVIF